MKALVIYYSYEGNTRLLAEKISKELGADLMEIKTIKESEHSGFFKYMWGGSQVAMGRRPPIREPEKDWRGFDLIVLGFPIWSFNIAPPMATYLENVRISGKNVAIFASFEGNAGKAFQRVRGDIIPDNDFIGEQAFFAPLKKDREATLKQASEWAKKIMERK